MAAKTTTISTEDSVSEAAHADEYESDTATDGASNASTPSHTSYDG